MTTVKFGETNAGGAAPSPGAAAYAASRLGLRVFPLVPGAGTPAIKEYGEYATTDPALIQEWWSGEFAGFGVGIAAGPASGVWVLDIDTKKGVDGFASLSSLAGMHHAFGAEGLSFALDTMCVRTPSGGAHVYFRWAEGVVNSVGKLGPGLDVRSEGGYVRGPGWGGYAVVPRGPEGVRMTTLKAAPDWLVALAQKRHRSYEAEAYAPDTSWARFKTTKTLAVLGAAPSGARNDALNKAAFKLGASGAVDQGDAWKACRAVMASIGAGDDEAAQRRTFESGWNAGCARRGMA